MLHSSSRLFRIFDACYVLNLDRRKDRWAHVEKQIKRAKLNTFISPPAQVKRVSGVDGNCLNIESLYKSGVISDLGYTRYTLPIEEKLFGMDLTPGAIGCALGHRQIWDSIVAEKNKCALVMEDDVEFNPKFSQMIEKLWEKVPSDWGIVHFGGLDLLASGKPPRPFINNGIRRAYQGHRELTAYVINYKSAQRCLELSIPMTWQIDTHISSNFKDDVEAQDKYISDPMTYVFQPSLVIQITSMGTDVQKRPSDNPPLEDAARRMREFVGGQTSVR